MNLRGAIWGIGVFFILLLWFVLEPQKFIRPLESDSARVTATNPIPPLGAGEEGLVRFTASKATKAVEGVEIGLETSSGKEVPGEKLIRFSSAEAYRKFLATAPPGVVLGQIDALRSIRVKAGEWLSQFLAQSGGSLSANFYIRVPEVPLEVRQRGDAYYLAVGPKVLELIGAEEVKDSWGKGVKVALMDTPLEGVGMTGGETAGHGRAMQSLIQGFNGPGQGAAPGAEVLGFAVLDPEGKGSSFDLAQAIVKATDQGVRVINMSLGSEGDSPVVRDAIAYAVARGVVPVAAAGNEAVNRVSYPAAYDGVIAVASVDGGVLPDHLPQHLYFSNRGKNIDLAAPGFLVPAEWTDGKKTEVTGTSASTALVTGVAAALFSREPGLSGQQVGALMVKYADATGLPGEAEETGGGVINLQRVLERNQRGIFDMAIGGVAMKEEGLQGRILVGVQNRGTETVNSALLEMRVGGDRRKFYVGPLAPSATAAESMTFDLARGRLDGRIGVEVTVSVRGDQRNENDFWTGYFRISKEK